MEHLDTPVLNQHVMELVGDTVQDDTFTVPNAAETVTRTSMDERDIAEQYEDPW